MKIKKPAPKSPADASGGATIADRFRLDAPPSGGVASVASAKNGTINKTAALLALLAGGISLAIAGILTFMLYQHWEFLMPA